MSQTPNAQSSFGECNQLRVTVVFNDFRQLNSRKLVLSKRTKNSC